MTAYQRARNAEAQRRCRARKRAEGWRAPGTTRPPTAEARRIYNARYYQRRRGRAWGAAVAAQDGRCDSERGGVVSHYPPARRMAPIESGGAPHV